MIVEWLLGFALAIVTTLVSVLPAGDALGLPDFGPIFGMMRTLNSVFPVDAGLAVIAVLLGVNVVLFSLGLVRQLWSYVPFIGGR